MKLEDQVVSLELAMKLKELGVKQESLFSWYHHTTEDVENNIKDNWKLKMGSPSEAKTSEDVSAFTVAELGERLPFCYTTWTNVRGDDWWCGDLRGTLRPIDGATEADARAKMLIYLIELIENNLIEL